MTFTLTQWRKQLIGTIVLSFLTLLCLSQKKIIPQNGHSGSFVTKISPDDKQMITAGIDGKISLWDIHKTKAIKHLKSSRYPLLTIDWNYDAKKIATGGMDSVLRQYDAMTFDLIKEFKLNAPITQTCYHPKLNALAIGLSNGKVLVADTENGGIFHEIDAESYVTGIKFSSNGAMLFIATWDKGVVAYEMKDGKKMLTIPVINKANATGMDISPNNEIISIHLNNGSTEFVNLLKGETLGTCENQLYYQSSTEKLYTNPAITFDNHFLININKQNNIVITNRFDNSQITYNTISTSGKINSITTGNKGGFFIITDINGSMSIVYFDKEIYSKEIPLVWRKLQFAPERIFNINFISHDEVLAMTGNGYYNFNMRTGDMERRDTDSAKLDQTEYFVRYLTIEGQKEVYYYTDIIKHLGYSITGSTTTPLKAFAYSSDTNTIAFQTENNQITIYNIKNKKIIYFNKSTDESQLFNVTIGDNFAFQKNNMLFEIDPVNAQTKAIKLTDSNLINYACYDRVKNHLYLLDITGKITAFNNNTGDKLTLPKGLETITANIMSISGNGKKLALYSQGRVQVFDLEASKTTYEMTNTIDNLYTLTLNEDASMMAYAGDEGLVHVHNLNKKEPLFDVLVSTQDGMIVYDKNNYYMATKLAARQIVMSDQNELSTLENFDLTLNRPDILLKEIGLSDDKLITAYKAAFDKRIKRSNLNNQKTNSIIPEIMLTNKKELTAFTIRKDIDLEFHLNGNGINLSKINLWINDVPVKNKNKDFAKTEVNTSINLPLMNGTNKIKYSVTNQDGAESDKNELVIVNLSAKKPDLYLLCIGTSEYNNPKFNLSYAAKDANDIASQFNSSFSSSSPFGKIFTKTLTNKEVTKENIQQQIGFLKKATINDIVIIFIAGHGVRDEQLNYYFATTDMDFNKPSGKGFSEIDLDNMVDEITALKKLIFFDTCLSGEIDKDEAEQTLATTTNTGDITFRKAGAGLRTKATGLNNASALMRELYNDITDATGSTVISSAGGAEYAMESDQWKNGLFTYCLLNGLKTMQADSNKDNTITVHELQNYVRKQVFSLSRGKQQPSFKNENKTMDFRIW